ncbi:hypothetical protein FQN60_006673, partial [Etheostoma spectabile]
MEGPRALAECLQICGCSGGVDPISQTEMLPCILFIGLFLTAARSQDIHPLQASSSISESCDSLCSCEEKDGILYLNCEQRNISKISQIKVPSGVPFHLNLYKNDLVELRAEEMEGLKNALSLHIGGNSIQELEPGVFSTLGSLKKLHINSNFLITLKEDTFQGLVNLEFLQADTNFIRVIEPGAFNKLIRLKVLILNDNSIEFLPNNIFRFVPLTHLDLRGNKLQTLPYVGFLEHIGRIMELLLEDNDWVCDCDILHLKIWMENMRAQSAIGDVVCSTPHHLKGTILAKVKRDVLCPSHADINLEEPSKSLDMVVTPSSKVSQSPKLIDAKDDAKIFRNVPLTKLNLRKNLLMHLPVSNVLDQLVSLEQIYLEDNPWDCSCDLLSLKQWVEKLRKETVVGSILCHTPKKVMQAELRSLRHEMLCAGLGTYHPMSPGWEESVTATLGPDSPGKDLFSSLTNTVPLSVLILSLLMFVLMIIFCSAGLVVFVVHRRRRRAKKKAAEEQPRENSSSSPIHLHYSMYGQKTTHHTLTQRTGSAALYEERSHSPIVQICRNPTYCSQHKEHDADLDYGLEEPIAKHHVCRSIMEKENTSPLTGNPCLKFRPMTGECPAEFVTLGNPNSLYRNILEREKELQQLGITEYLRKNMPQLQSAVDMQVPGHQEELKLMETIMYSRPRKVMLEQTQNEYFELKANLHTEPDYLEVWLLSVAAAILEPIKDTFPKWRHHAQLPGWWENVMVLFSHDFWGRPTKAPVLFYNSDSGNKRRNTFNILGQAITFLRDKMHQRHNSCSCRELKNHIVISRRAVFPSTLLTQLVPDGFLNMGRGFSFVLGRRRESLNYFSLSSAVSAIGRSSRVITLLHPYCQQCNHRLQDL